MDREFVDTVDMVIRVEDKKTVIGSNFSSGDILSWRKKICLIFNYLVGVTIKVADIDDNVPQFLNFESWRFEVDETDANGAFMSTNLTQRITVEDEDINQKFYFTLQGNGIADGLIELVQAKENSSEALLQVVKPIDREDPLIDAQNAQLKYSLKVTDAGGNTNQIEVRQKSLFLPLHMFVVDCGQNQ